MSLKVFEPVICEFGWEVQLQGYFRLISRRYKKSVVTTYPGMDAFYKDFATVLHHDKKDRSLYHQIGYRVQGEYIKFGNPDNIADVLIHARNITRGGFKNYKSWDIVAKQVPAGYIGTRSGDSAYSHLDLRGLPLEKLMDIIAGAKVVVGASSGVMHLAQMCGTPVVVWGDRRTYWNETLEKRYKETWNRLGTKVIWIDTEFWQPEPDEVINAVRSIL